jgi:hypothetical protein
MFMEYFNSRLFRTFFGVVSVAVSIIYITV